MERSTFQSAAWCRATTLTERRDSLPENQDRRSACNRDLAEHRMRRWQAQTPFAAGTHFARRLAIDGLNDEDLFYCLGEPAEALNDRLTHGQEWTQQLTRAFASPLSSEAPPLPEELLSHHTVGFLNLIAPLLHEALNRVSEAGRRLAEGRLDLPFDPQNVAALLFVNLPQQLLLRLSRTMVLELNVARLEGLLDGMEASQRFDSFVKRLRQRDVAASLFEEYPVLARQLVLRTNQWVNYSIEFLQHLITDWESLRDTFQADSDAGMLSEVRSDVGDSHRGGRSVLIAKFSAGLQVVYKPRSLSIDVHFQELLAWLNERGDYPAFRTLKILNHDTYGWTEFVAAARCSSVTELRRFYERQGAYLALLYALEATDFHFENLIAAGEHPVLLDLEALMHPRLKSLDLRQAAQAAGNTMTYSVLRVGLLPQRSLASGEFAGLDVSGLGSMAGELTPHPVPYWLSEGTDEMRLGRKRMEIPEGQNQPTLNGAEVHALDYARAVEAGFSSMYRCLVEHQDEFLSDQGPLARFANDEVRVIMRPTYIYNLLLTESFHPDALRDALDRDRLFDRLWVGIEECPQLATIIPAEVHDLHNGDVPIFTTRPNSRDLWTSSHQRIADFYDRSGGDLVRRRIQRLSDQDRDLQLWFIRASLATLSEAGDGARRPLQRQACADPSPKAPADRKRLLAAARAVGERLEQLALKEEGDLSWIGLTLAPSQHWVLVPTGLDLYDGLPGVVLFLAHLGKTLGETRFTALAREAAAMVSREVGRTRPSTLPIGGFGGWGGVVYALTHLGCLWNEPALFTEAEEIAGRLTTLVEGDTEFDLIGGAAGCIVALLALYRSAPSQDVLSTAVRCGHHLLAHAQPFRHGFDGPVQGPTIRRLTGFSHGAAGIAWALLELAAVSRDERFRTTALVALEYERRLFFAAEGNWPDLREVEASSVTSGHGAAKFATSWCHGAPGIGLARLLCLRHLDDAYIHSEINAAVETTLRRGFSGSHCLCHGSLGNLELLLQASLRLEEPRWQAEVDRVAAVILQGIDQNGFVCGNPLGVESPGLMTGLAGIGYELLRLAEPDLVPSIMALELPTAETR
jgi:type 2 lantibiotic biosynthesis protein LanM